MAGDPNLYDELDATIAKARQSLPSDEGIDVTDASSWSQADQQALADVQSDYELVQGHRNIRSGVVKHESRVTHCAGCGEQRPCPTIRDLATKYSVSGSGDRSFGDYEVLTRAQRDADKVGQCACGLAGRQWHHSLSRPGE